MSDARLIVASVLCAFALGAVGSLGPPGAALALVALPLPLVVAGGVGGTAHAAVATFATAGAFGGLFGVSAMLGFVAVVGVPAIVAVFLLRAARRLEAVLVGVVSATVAGAVALAIWHEPNIDAWRAAIASTWQASFDSSLQIYRDFGVSSEGLAELESARADVTARIVAVVPALLLLVTTAWWLLAIGMSRRWVGWPQLVTLTQWRTADWMIWVLIASGFALVLLPSDAGIATNLFVIAVACYFAQGLAIVGYFLQRAGLPRPLRAATFAAIGLQYLVAALVVVLGVFDLWVDFRNLAAQPVDAAPRADAD